MSVVKFLPEFQSSFQRWFLFLSILKQNIILYCQRGACIHKTEQLVLNTSCVQGFNKKFMT